jgi:hypothetical protein
LRPPVGFGLSVESTLTAPPDAKPHRGRVGVSFAMSMAVPLTVEGTYIFTATVNDQDSRELSFDVEVQPVGRADA